MSRLRTFFFNLNGVQRAVVMAAVILLIAVVLSAVVLYPAFGAYTRGKGDLARLREVVWTQAAQLKKLGALGETNKRLEPEQIESLRASENEIAYASQVPDFLEALKSLGDQTGASEFTLTEGDISPAYVSLGPRRDVYEVMRLPVAVTFRSDYAVASNYLFQLREMKRLLRLESLEIVSVDKAGSGAVKVSLKIGIYFVEES